MIIMKILDKCWNYVRNELKMLKTNGERTEKSA